MRSAFGGNEWVQSWVLPDQIEVLPMRLLRAQLYPGSPQMVMEGVAEYEQNLAAQRAGQYRAPEMFPIRMVQTHHKLAPTPTSPQAAVMSAYLAIHGRPGARGVTARLAEPPHLGRLGAVAYVPMDRAPRYVGASEISNTIGPDMRPILRANAPRAERVAGPQALHDPRATRASRNHPAYIRARNAARAPLDSATRHLMRKARIGQ